MSLFIVYVNDEKEIDYKRVFSNPKKPLDYQGKRDVANKLFNNDPPNILWLIADDPLDIEDLILEQFRSKSEFIRCFGRVV